VTDGSTKAQPTTWDQLASTKLAKVVGEVEADSILRDAFKQLGLTSLSSADELYALAQNLSRRVGFVATVGALLSLTAVLRGARAQQPKSCHRICCFENVT
jgi:hypothetical protein